MATDQKKKKGGIKSLFFEIDETKTENETEPTESISVSTTLSTPSAAQPVLDKDIYAQLIRVLSENNVDGYDYFEFRGSLENMRSVIPAEGDRFKAAFAAVSSIVSIDKIISSADFYLSKLAEKKAEFDKYVQQVTDAKVTDKEAEAAKIKEMIVAKTKEITLLNEEINKLQEVSRIKQNDAVAERAKIETVKNNFNATSNKVVTDIEADKNKISSYLNQGK